MKHFIHIFVLLIMVFSNTIVAEVNNEDSDGKVVVGVTAPSFALRSLKNELIFIRDFCGETLRKPYKNKIKHVIVLSFFASWCKPCLKEIPILHEIHSSFKDQPLMTFLINETDTREIAQDLVDEQGFTLPVLMDEYGTTAKNYEVADAKGRASLPRLFVLDKNGVIRLINKGFEGNEKEFKNSLTELLKQLLAE